MDLWKNYKATVAKIFPDIQFVQRHAEWTNKKGVNLTADLYKGDHLIKSRHCKKLLPENSYYKDLLLRKIR